MKKSLTALILLFVLFLPYKVKANLEPNMEEEIISLRDEFTKHYKNADGSITAISYQNPVHYLDKEKKWQEIDNSLIIENQQKSLLMNEEESKFYKLKNNQNFNVLFNSSPSEKELIKLKKENEEIKIGIKKKNQ